MDKCYLFGAGINCIAVIKFLRKENIIAVIDNDEKKIGSFIEDIPIISLQEYIEKSNGEDIFITSYFHADELGNEIKAKTSAKHYKSPYMQMGYYEDVDDIIDKLNLDQNRKILFYRMDPIAKMIAQGLKEKKEEIEISFLEKDFNQIDTNENIDCPIVVTCDESEATEIFLEKKYGKNRIINISHIYMKKYYFKNHELSRFKNIHKGKRCFLIGNGPSLKYEDLETLHDNHEVCFGANRIYLAYENTQWRPDYYVVVDYLIAQKDYDRIREIRETKFIRHFYKTKTQNEANETYEFQGYIYEQGKPKFSDDIGKGIYSGNTVIYDMLQIAIYMGFTEIYLLGVDMTSGIRPEAEGAHFYKTPDKNERLLVGNRAEIMLAFEHAKKILGKQGYVIKNATRGGELEVFERVDFDDLF